MGSIVTFFHDFCKFTSFYWPILAKEGTRLPGGALYWMRCIELFNTFMSQDNKGSLIYVMLVAVYTREPLLRVQKEYSGPTMSLGIHKRTIPAPPMIDLLLAQGLTGVIAWWCLAFQAVILLSSNNVDGGRTATYPRPCPFSFSFGATRFPFFCFYLMVLIYRRLWF